MVFLHGIHRDWINFLFTYIYLLSLLTTLVVETGSGHTHMVAYALCPCRSQTPKHWVELWGTAEHSRLGSGRLRATYKHPTGSHHTSGGFMLQAQQALTEGSAFPLPPGQPCSGHQQLQPTSPWLSGTPGSRSNSQSPFAVPCQIRLDLGSEKEHDRSPENKEFLPKRAISKSLWKLCCLAAGWACTVPWAQPQIWAHSSHPSAGWACRKLCRTSISSWLSSLHFSLSVPNQAEQEKKA